MSLFPRTGSKFVPDSADRPPTEAVDRDSDASNTASIFAVFSSGGVVRRFAPIAWMAAAIALSSYGPEARAQENADPVDESRLSDYRLLNTFGEVLGRIRKSYVTEKTQEELVLAAIRGMLQSLDPHSDYLDSELLDGFRQRTQGQFGGLGIEVTMEDGLVKIIAPHDDTPASRAGLMPGDLITHIDGSAVRGLTLNECVDLMRGERGTPITITVLREGTDPFEVTMVRDRILLPSVRWRREADVGYIRLGSFSERTLGELTSAIESLKSGRPKPGDKTRDGGPPEGYVVDLRNNPGGLLDQAIKVADVFLERGEIVSTRGRDGAVTQRINARPGDLIEGAPLVVLINRGSASAAELVAGALKDHRRAVLVGERSFGKGSVQSVFPLETKPDAVVKLTVQLYYTPSGESIQAVGIEPDVTVSQANLEVVEKPAGPRGEASLPGAIGAGRNKSAGNENRGYTEAADKDYQLLRALDLAHALTVAVGPDRIADATSESTGATDRSENPTTPADDR